MTARGDHAADAATGRGRGSGGREPRSGGPTRFPGPSASDCVGAPDGSCSICGDEGLEGVVLHLLARDRAGVRLPDGAVLEVATDLVDDVRPGDRLLLHLGFAIAKIREGAA